MTCYALFCSSCHMIVQRDEESLIEPPAANAPEHPTTKGDRCPGSQKPAIWHLVADDN